ncbi:MAG: hypothetical protein KOO63_01070 [Bacteroidales bacterium]|nr:hypothetical protein [Candidatus Latescibacterota bacterium]
MWKNKGPWVAVAIIVVASVLLATVAFAQGDERSVRKGRSCRSDRQVAVAECGATQAPCSVADKGDCCKSLKNKAVYELCTHCGHLKGSEKCCSKDLVKCDKCGLAKGSPGCCKIPAGVKKAGLCGKCGQIKGTDECCAKDIKTCGKCGLAKGSPGCCNLQRSLSKDDLCGKCGFVKGSGDCCRKDMKKCGKCGMALGSPGCCLKGDHVCVPDCREDEGKKSKRDKG